VRIGVLGCGQVAVKGALPGFSPPDSARASDAAAFLRFGGAPDVTIALVADIDRARAESAAALFGARHVWVGDATPVVGDFKLDGVVVCTPPHALAQLATAALEAGVSVLVEKPVVRTRPQLTSLLAARRRRPELACMVNLVWAYHPAVERAHKLVAEGAVGVVERVTCVFEHGGPEGWAPDAAWYRAPGSGGPVADLGLHVIGIVERVVGASVALEGSSGERITRGYVGAAEAVLEVGWDASSPRFVLDLEGTEASLSLRLIPWAAAERSLLFAPHSGRARLVAVGEAATRGGPYRDFADALRLGRVPLAEVTTLEAALRSYLVWTGRF
jgi:predicted dehydrogenase